MAGGMDPAMMEQLMASMGGGKGGGKGGGMDMAQLQAMMGGMGGGGGMMGGGGPEDEMKRKAQSNQQAHMAKNSGEEVEGGVDGKTWKWEQTSDLDEGGEILVRFPLAVAATKKDVQVVFKSKELKVTVAGEELINGKTFGTVSTEDSTWCLVDKGTELQVLLALAVDIKWDDLLA